MLPFLLCVHVWVSGWVYAHECYCLPMTEECDPPETGVTDICEPFLRVDGNKNSVNETSLQPDLLKFLLAVESDMFSVMDPD